MEPEIQNSPNGLVSREAEVAFLLKRLLEITGNRAPVRPGFGLTASRETTCGDETVFDLELGGVQYKLIRRQLGRNTAASLSPREQEIVRLVSSGHANKTIAHKLAISQHTVNTHVRRIFGKLGVNTRAEMVAFALQSGLVNQTPHFN